MGDFFYDLVRAVGRPIVRITSRLTILHRERLPRTGPFILAPNHLSPFDVPILIAVSPRRLDFVSVVEMHRKPFVGPFFRGMNVTFLDRSRRDTRATICIVRKLQAGRVVAMFPEGQIRSEAESVIFGGPFKPGVIKLAATTGVPILPCVVLGAAGYHSPLTWLPVASVKATVNYGRPFRVSPEDEEAGKRQLAAAFVELAQEIQS